jgi:hypothetical protein
VIPYIHYSNGTIEVLCKLVLQALRVLLSELRMEKSDWPRLVKTVEHYLNHKVQARLAGRAPVEVMCPAIRRDNPLEFVLRHEGTSEFGMLAPEQIDAIMKPIEEYLPVLHKAVSAMSDSQRALHRKYADKKARPVNFGVGDFVLCAKDVDQLEGKLYVTWRGPYRVVEAVHSHIFKVQDVVHEDKLHEAHISRMRLYNDSSLDITEELKLQKYFDDESFIIERVVMDRGSGASREVFIKWQGFSEKENSWEPVSLIERDAPGTWKEYLVSKSKKAKRKPRLDEDDDYHEEQPISKRRKPAGRR